MTNHARVDQAMDRYASGDAAAFAIVYDELSPQIYGFLLRRTRQPDLAEDLLQHTFLSMHYARASFLTGSAVRPWAFAIARRLLIDLLRKSGREILDDSDESNGRPEAVSSEANAEELLQAQRLAKELNEVLAGLPENQRVAYELVRIEGLPLAEVAEILGTTVTAVKLRAHRAYEALRGRIANLEEAEAAVSSTRSAALAARGIGGAA